MARKYLDPGSIFQIEVSQATRLLSKQGKTSIELHHVTGDKTRDATVSKVFDVGGGGSRQSEEITECSQGIQDLFPKL